MTPLEHKQIEYLKREKEVLVDNFIGVCEEINNQIKDVKSGHWLAEIKKKSQKESECVVVNGNGEEV